MIKRGKYWFFTSNLIDGGIDPNSENGKAIIQAEWPNDVFEGVYSGIYPSISGTILSMDLLEMSSREFLSKKGIGLKRFRERFDLLREILSKELN